MTLSLENKHGGKLKRWSLTTALWPRDRGHRNMYATLQCPPWNVLQCVCTRSCLCFSVATAGMWLSCAWMCAFVCFSVSVLRAKWNTVIKETLLAPLLFFGNTCIMLLDAKINVPHINVKEMQRRCLWMFGWLTHWSGCDTLPPRALSCQRLLLSLLALTHTSHHSPDRGPGASPVRTHQTLPWAPEPCSGSSNPIIAGLTVIANIRDTLTWLERMKTSTVKVKRGDEWGWYQVWRKWVTSGTKQEGKIATQCSVMTRVRINCSTKVT